MRWTILLFALAACSGQSKSTIDLDQVAKVESEQDDTLKTQEQTIKTGGAVHEESMGKFDEDVFIQPDGGVVTGSDLLAGRGGAVALAALDGGVHLRVSRPAERKRDVAPVEVAKSKETESEQKGESKGDTDQHLKETKESKWDFLGSPLKWIGAGVLAAGLLLGLYKLWQFKKKLPIP